MERIKDLILMAMLCLFLPCLVSAQIEVYNNGQVAVGGKPASQTSQLYVKSGAAGEGIDIDFMNMNAWAYAVNTNVPLPKSTSYRVAQLTGPGVYTTMFYVTGDGYIWCNGVTLPSDSTIKKNIVRIPNALDKINRIGGYNYHYKATRLTKGYDSGKIFCPDTFMHIGVLAQEVEKVAPYIVKESANGKKSIDYIQLIPLLLQGIKELKTQVDSQTEELALLQARFSKLSQSLDTASVLNSGIGKTSSRNGNYVLGQNSPNPFNVETNINYQLNGNYASAFIYVFDLQGGLKKTFRLTNSSGNITIKANELNPGMYLYSLVVDGKGIDEKKMLLTN